MSNYDIKDAHLAEGGRRRIDWAEREMPVLRLIRDLPQKKFYSVTSAFVCPNMKKVTLQEVRDSLKFEQYEVSLSADEISAARRSLDRMVSL
jgi:quinolinate synthase